MHRLYYLKIILAATESPVCTDDYLGLSAGDTIVFAIEGVLLISITFHYQPCINTLRGLPNHITVSHSFNYRSLLNGLLFVRIMWNDHNEHVLNHVFAAKLIGMAAPKLSH